MFILQMLCLSLHTFVFIFTSWQVKFFQLKALQLTRAAFLPSCDIWLLLLSLLVHTTSDATEMQNEQWEKSNSDGDGNITLCPHNNLKLILVFLNLSILCCEKMSVNPEIISSPSSFELHGNTLTYCSYQFPSCWFCLKSKPLTF